MRTARSTACPTRSASRASCGPTRQPSRPPVHGSQDPRRAAALTEKIKADGKTPWCIAAESGAATGWPITDWIEDLVLRFAGPDNYDKWVKGELKFNSPEIKPAWEYFQKIAFPRATCAAARSPSSRPTSRPAATRCSTQPPGCYLFKQATFVANKGGFPDEVIAKLDNQTGPFPFPAKTAGDNPVLVGGDIAAAFNNDPNTIKLRNFIASKENGTQQAKAARSRRTRRPTCRCCRTRRCRRSPPTCSTRPPAARFDGSDLMPAKVGAGTFWTEPVKWLSGQQDLDTTLNNIDDSFPKTGADAAWPRG